ncbi:MAG TPA: zf-HC2 domain-containing protein, partial [Candidatus Omnitrophota bacterium]|nr:zf-HC2 domain-containing protein [Candidatus Omnitrophota bacterium]
MNRICPSELVLSEYMSGMLSHSERETVEKHLASCDACREIVADTHTVLMKMRPFGKKSHFFSVFTGNVWFMGACALLLLSFFVPQYFVQLLVASILA